MLKEKPLVPDSRHRLHATRLILPLLALLLAGALPASGTPRYEPGAVLFRLRPAAVAEPGFLLPAGARSAARTGLADVDEMLAAHGLTEVRAPELAPVRAVLARDLGLDRDFRAVVDGAADIEALARALTALLEVESASPNWAMELHAVPNDSLYSLQWGHDNRRQMRQCASSQCNTPANCHESGAAVGTVGFDAAADSAWDACQGYGSAAIVIAVLDTGADLSHPDLRLVTGRDFGDGDSDPTDDTSFSNTGHGTACAGVAAAIANNTRGVAGAAGGCSVMPLKVSTSNGSFFHSAIRNALVYAADNGAHIASMSFGGPASSDLAAGVSYAYNAGVTLFASTGNNNDSTIAYPARYTDVIAIGAASPCGERKRSSSAACDVPAGVFTDPLGVTCDGERYWGSNYGTGIDFIAPTIMPTTDIQGSRGYSTAGYYKWFSGTSCSAPYAGGVAALILSQNPSLSPSQVKQAMINAAADVTAGDAAAGYDIRTGYGMVNALNAVGRPFTDVTSGPLGDTGPGYGVAWGDYDADGDPDLYLTNAGTANKLFRNDGGSLVDATSGPLGDAGFGTGAAWGDHDNDGDLDLLLTNSGQSNKLLRNDGAAGFADATPPMLAGPSWQNTNGAAWADFDRDGDVDPYVVNRAWDNQLFDNLGCGAFDGTLFSPVFDPGNGQGAAWGDYDNDGDPDLVLTNEGSPNKLLRNDGSGAFTDVTSGPVGGAGSRGAAWGDYDNDGDLDLYLSNRWQVSNKLLRNDGGAFNDVTTIALADLGDGQGVAWADYDLDGDLDLYLANRGQANKLYRNDGSGGAPLFRDATIGPLGNTGATIGVGWADYDLDGDPDLYIANLNSANKLMRNDWACGAHWLHVRPRGTASNAAGIGARVRVVAGGRAQIREASGSAGFMSQNDLTAMFGLGNAAAADTVEVRWPSGAVQRLLAVGADQVLQVAEPGPSWMDVARGVGLLCDPANTNGVAWGDYDGDGDPDLYLSKFGSANRLVRNDGSSTFSDATAGPVGDAGRGNGVAWGDYDNDADLDLVLANDDVSNRLFRNDGGGFTDSTPGPLGSALGFGVAWADADRDGDLDLYVTRTGPNKLLRNDGGGSFADATPGPLGDGAASSAAAWGDYDSDGDPDLYLANANAPNRLFRNDGGLAFADVTAGPLGDAAATQGVAWGDYDNDGDLDLYLANWNTANKLLRNDGAGSFADATSGPLGDSGAGEGVAWGDCDNDGDLDLYLCNLASPNKLLRNDGAGSFADATSGFLGDRGWSTAAAWADQDGDGDLDLFVADYGQASRLLRNDLATGDHWIHVDLAGTTSNRDGIGARVRVVAGSLVQIREIEGGSGLFSQNSLTAEFGVGSATSIDSVQVLWPSGVVQTITSGFMPIPVDRRIEVVEPESEASQDLALAPAATRAYPSFPNPFNPTTTIRYDLAAPAAVSLLIYDLSGRVVRVLEPPGARAAGRYRVTWDGRSESGARLASGVYLYRIEAGTYRESRRLVLLK